MTTVADIANRALQAIGSRTTVTAAELLAASTNEAKQFNIAYANNRDSLLRMAPWDCAMNTMTLAYISSLPGTPENSSAATQFWQKGQPAPPWTYEYQYPADCLRAQRILPANMNGFTGVPITTAITGGASTYYGPPVRFKVVIDQFMPVTAAAVVDGGSGYVIGDKITLEAGLSSNPPIGAPAVLTVLTVLAGAVLTVAVDTQIIGRDDDGGPVGGSYFEVQTNPVAQGSSTGSGTGATFNLTFGAKLSQRVIVTNQEYAVLDYVKQVTDPNLFDALFQDALVNVTAADMSYALTGKGSLSNKLIEVANNSIVEARKADANEGLTVNDVTPDWIRVRGWQSAAGYDGLSGFNNGYDWGALWPMYS